MFPKNHGLWLHSWIPRIIRWEDLNTQHLLVAYLWTRKLLPYTKIQLKWRRILRLSELTNNYSNCTRRFHRLLIKNVMKMSWVKIKTGKKGSESDLNNKIGGCRSRWPWQDIYWSPLPNAPEWTKVGDGRRCQGPTHSVEPKCGVSDNAEAEVRQWPETGDVEDEEGHHKP